MSDYITSQIPELWEQLKYGDLIEDVSESGYRSEGVFVVTKTSQSDGENLIKQGLEIASLCCDEYDDYGTVPPDFYLITRFPLGYHSYENMVTNNTYALTHSGPESYWHCEPYPAPLDIKKLKLDSDHLTIENVFHQVIGTKKVDFSYVVITYKGDNYMICDKTVPKSFMNRLSNNTLFVQTTYGKSAIESFTYNYKVDEKEIMKILEDEKVPVQNFLWI